jgi:mycothiol synthase
VLNAPRSSLSTTEFGKRYVYSMTNRLEVPVDYSATVGGAIDATELTGLVARVEDHFDGTARATKSFIQMLLDAPQTNRCEGTLCLRETRTGSLVAFGLHQSAEPHVESTTDGWVDPGHVSRGLGSAIVSWGLRKAQSEIHLAPEGARVTNRCQASDADTAAASVFGSLGYTKDRREIEMHIRLEGPVEILELPPSVRIRTMSGIEDLPIVADVISDAFKDHYGWVESSREQTMERWLNFRSMDEWDDDLVYIAEAPEGAVGVLVGVRSDGSRVDVGFVGSLGVARSWRGMGLARALLTRAFDRYQRRGMRSVALDVDADSLTGATRLYRSIGMEPARSETAYLVELRPGTEFVRR